jgi:hypothetical protein
MIAKCGHKKRKTKIEWPSFDTAQPPRTEKAVSKEQLLPQIKAAGGANLTYRSPFENLRPQEVG